MLLSLFTPTHNPIYLQDAYRTLTHQIGDVPFEWVIVPNGGPVAAAIPAEILADPRVRIVEAPDVIKGVGALKLFACQNCKGDVFVEFDHDDMLAPHALDELAKAYTQAPNGFYYSDFVNLKRTGQSETFNRLYGWRIYNCIIDGRNYTATSAFEPSARAMCEIFYAPNHVRAWSKTAYEQVGGHDPALFVGDDHDLVCRTYIANVPFVYIKQPLYIYRCTEGQTFREHNEKVQEQQAANFHKYLHSLAFAEARRNGKIALDLGREDWCPQGYYNHDLIAQKLQMRTDLAEGSVGVVRVVDCLQKVPQEQIVPLINEVYRILAPGGWFLSSTPSIDDGNGHMGRGAFQDPTNVSYWSANNFLYWCHANYAKLLRGFDGRFQEVRKWTDYPSDWHKANFIPYVNADLSALKGQRQAGITNI